MEIGKDVWKHNGYALVTSVDHNNVSRCVLERISYICNYGEDRYVLTEVEINHLSTTILEETFNVYKRVSPEHSTKNDYNGACIAIAKYIKEILDNRKENNKE